MRGSAGNAQTVAIKRDQIPYNYIKLNSSASGGSADATTVSKNISVANGYKEGITTILSSGYAWDTALKFVGDNNWARGTGTQAYKQNYLDSEEFTFLKYSSANLTTATKVKGTSAGIILTGQGEATKNIFDMGGNLCEYTSEVYDNTGPTMRAGCYTDDYSTCPAGVRQNKDANASKFRTFRPTLYLVEPVKINSFSLSANATNVTVTILPEYIGEAGTTYQYQIDGGDWVTTDIPNGTTYTFTNVEPATQHFVNVLINETAQGSKSITTNVQKTMKEVSTVADAITYSASAIATNDTSFRGIYKVLMDSNNATVKIPVGFTVRYDSGATVNDGIVIADSNDNQWVWIPVDSTNNPYVRTDYKNTGEYSNYSETLSTIEEEGINAGGYYIGRYESGSEEDTTAVAMRTGATSAQTVVIKKNQVPYNHVAVNSTKAGSGKGNCTDLAEGIANANGYKTGIITRLCSSYAWDTALKFVNNDSWSKGTGTGYQSIKQNYKDSATYKYLKPNKGVLTVIDSTPGAEENVILTGQGDATKNIYDMGGNCVEYTSESCSGANIYVVRGTSYDNIFATNPAGFRNNKDGASSVYRTFRATMFLVEDNIPAFTTEANATSITVTVSPDFVGEEGTTYQYQINGGAWQNPRISTDTTYTFTGLTPETMYTVNVKIGENEETPQTVTTKEQKTMKQVNTVEDAIQYSATAISANDTTYDSVYKELSDSTGATVKVPVGFTVRYDSAKTVDEGIVVADQNDNQWVWIPVNANNTYERRDYGKYNGVYTDFSETLSGVETNVAGIGGYYIGRYEAGSAEDTTARAMRNGYGDGQAKTITLKRDQVPYNYLKISSSVSGYGSANGIALSNNIATANGYKSGIVTKLCSSYAWDTALNFVGNESWSKGTGTGYKEIKQNYKDSIVFKYLKYDNGNLIEADKITDPNATNEYMLTGQGDATKNIYDMGGNYFEYTTEKHAGYVAPYTERGADRNLNYSNYPAGWRQGSGGEADVWHVIRPTLYFDIPTPLSSSNVTFDYSTINWTNQNIVVGVTVDNSIIGTNTLRYKIGENGTWTDYNSTNKITMTENGTIYVALYNGNVYGGSATAEVTKIDKSVPTVNSDIAKASITEDSISTTITVTDTGSGLGQIIWYYKNSTDANWSNVTDTYQASGTTAGAKTEQMKTHTFVVSTEDQVYQFYAEVYDVAGNMIASKSASTPLAITPEVLKYAVQIYGINQDEDENGNVLGLTFGPALVKNCNNAYITHTYESDGNGGYNVVIVTHDIATDGTETVTREFLTDSEGNNIIRTDAEKTKYDKNIHNMTWKEIAEVNDKTEFTDCLLCGDTKSVKLKLNSTIKNSSENIPEQYGDGAGILYDSIISDYRMWNPSQSNNSYVGTGVTLDSDEKSNGSNARNAGGYSVSHIRATLIGKNAKTNEGYGGDVNLTSDTCLYSCIESDLRAVITPKKIKYVTGTSTSSYTLNDDIADSIWLFSDREMYGTGEYSGNRTEGLGASGVGYDKFGNTESKYYISSYTINKTSRFAYTEDGSPYPCWWLRSPALNTSYSARSLNYNSGMIVSYWAKYTYGIAFGFCINTVPPSYTTEVNATNITLSVSPDYVGPDGTTYQYQINGGAWQNARLTTDSTHTFTGLTPETQYTVNVKIGNEVQTAQTVTTRVQKTMKQVSTVVDAIKYSATAISATDDTYNGVYKELTDSAGDTVKVPVGFTVRYDSAKLVDNGIVVADQNDNQWVWIPVNVNNPYTRAYASDNKLVSVMPANSVWPVYYEAIPTGAEAQVTDIGGYYIARYEPSSLEDSNNKTMRTADSEPRTVMIKRDKIPYNYIAINDELANSGKGNAIDLSLGISIANNYKEGIVTKLCSSYAWDTALKFLDNESWALGTNQIYLYIKQNNPDSASFKYLKYNNNVLVESTSNANDLPIMLTGQGDATKNIYDMGGNCDELTTEYMTNTNMPYVLRGGSRGRIFENNGASYRNSYGTSHPAHSFRPTLYLGIPGLNSSNVAFDYSTIDWTNQDVIVGATVSGNLLDTYTLRYKIGSSGTWTDYDSTNKVTVTSNNTVYFALYDGSAYGESATAEVTKIDKTLPTVSSVLAKDSITDNSITTKVTVMDTLSGLGRIVWYYKNLTDSEWSSVTDTYQAVGATAGATSSQTKTHTFALDTFDETYQFYAEVYDVAGNMIASKSSNDPLIISGDKAVRYAVQIYGINQDEDGSGNTLGLTFGPATGANYNNAYVTHTYEETSEGSGVYNVIIETHTVASDGTETITTENLVNSEGNNVTRTLVDKNKYDINMHEMTWTEIAQVSDKTAFTDCMLCGDTKSVKLKLNDTIKSGNTYNQYGDGAGGLYRTINSTTNAYYTTWNPSKSQNSYMGTDVLFEELVERYGSNAREAGGYASSHIRATLIGFNNRTNENYAGDVNLTADTCLYNCIEEGLKNVISAKKVKYVTGNYYNNPSLNDDILDKIWLFSEREMYGTGQYTGNASEGLCSTGVGYARFSNTESKDYIQNYNNNAIASRKAYNEQGSAQEYWFRSAYLLTDSILSYMYTNGKVGNAYAYSQNGLAFGFCIDTVPTYTVEANATNITVSVSPDSIGNELTMYQYQINGGAWQNARLSSDSTHTFTNLTPGTQYTVNVKIGGVIQVPQIVETPLQKTMKEVSTVTEAIRHSAIAISATDTDYTGTFKELTDSTGATVKVPVGFTVRYDSGKKVNEGIVVADQNDNQWVWIPVNANNPYTRTWYGASGLETLLKTSATANEQLTISGTPYYVYYESEPVSGDVDYDLANRAGGYYIARYEAGVSGATTMRTGYGSAQTVSIKRDQVPYNYIKANANIANYGTVNAQTVSENIASANGYKTGITTKLCNSYAWDTALNFIGNESWAKGTGTGYQSIRQNYKDSNTFEYLKYINGNLRAYDKPTGYDFDDEVMLTGQGDATKNIYDMGGNCYEYISELTSYSNYPIVSRGGIYDGNYDSSHAGSRGSNSGSANGYISFRPTLYLSNVPTDLNSSNITFTYSKTIWTNQDVIVGVNIGNNVKGNNTIRYKIGSNGTWTDYNSTDKITVTENNTIYVALYDGENYGVSATTEITKIDKTLPVASLNLGPSAVTNSSISLEITVTDVNSGLGKTKWYYKNATDTEWSSATDTYQSAGSIAGNRMEQTKTHTFSNLTKGATYQFYAEVYDVAGNMISSKSANNPLEIECLEIVKYAVQIYGINQDEDANGNTLGLTFGPAMGNYYDNAYVTHTYEDNGNGGFNVVVVTHNVVSDGSETITTEYLTNSSGNIVTRTLAEKNQYDINIHDMTWTEIAEVTDKTSFTDCMLCGDTKSVKLNLNDTIKTKGYYYTSYCYGDGYGSIGYNKIDNYYLKWNVSENDNEAAINGGTEGNSAVSAGGYSSSHVRATLIGANSKTDITYAGDDNLSESTCFYSCFEEEVRDLITPKKVKYATGNSQNTDIADKIWLFSEREICSRTSTLEGLGEEECAYDKFVNTDSKYYITNPTGNSLSQRIVRSHNWYTRTIASSDYVYTMHQDGGHMMSNPYLGSGLAVGFCIDTVPTQVKYAVQIYGINQDEDASGNTLGLTFGPAVGANYNNKYVTHTYEDNGNGGYNVVIVTHNVAVNGSETTSTQYLKNSSGNNVTRTLAEKNKYDVNIHNMTWQEISDTNDKTVFTDCMLCGDTKSVKLTLNKMIENSEASISTQSGDGAGALYYSINEYYRVWNPSKYDNLAIGTSVTLDCDEEDFGSNAKNAGGYKTSHIRASLIGSDISNPTIGYAGNDNLSSSTCLYSCIESTLRNVITPKKIKYVTGDSADSCSINDDIADSIWLFSEREMYGIGLWSRNVIEGLGTNGDAYAKFTNTESKYYVSTDTSNYYTNTHLNLIARVEGNNSRNAYWWLRTISLEDTCSAGLVSITGSLDEVSNCFHSNDLAFGFCID